MKSCGNSTAAHQDLQREVTILVARKSRGCYFGWKELCGTPYFLVGKESIHAWRGETQQEIEVSKGAIYVKIGSPLELQNQVVESSNFFPWYSSMNNVLDTTSHLLPGQGKERGQLADEISGQSSQFAYEVLVRI